MFLLLRVPLWAPITVPIRVPLMVPFRVLSGATVKGSLVELLSGGLELGCETDTQMLRVLQ